MLNLYLFILFDMITYHKWQGVNEKKGKKVDRKMSF